LILLLKLSLTSVN